MNDTSRRKFLATAAALGGVAALPAAGAAEPGSALPPLLHQVFFWLKNPDSAADRDALVAGLRTLAAVPSVRGLRIGVPAATEARGVVDSSYQVSELLMFDDLAGQQAYQDHPIHRQFVADCEHLWERVVVYDTLSL